jgi:hypothetical protein
MLQKSLDSQWMVCIRLSFNILQVCFAHFSFGGFMMPRSALALLLVFLPIGVAAQSPSSDPMALTVAQKSLAALVGQLAGHQANLADVTLDAEVTSSTGSETESGTGTFKARGFAESRVDLNLGGETRSDVRSASGGAWQQNGAAAKAYAGHNCMTDAAWFFPALSSLAQTANSSYVFKYIGVEEHDSVNTQHIQVFQAFPQDSTGVLQQLSTMDFYLNAASGLPVAVVFQTHADNNLKVNIPTEVSFSNYQTVSGIQIPFSFQKTLNGNVVLSAQVTSAVINTGLTDNLFSLQ